MTQNKYKILFFGNDDDYENNHNSDNGEDSNLLAPEIDGEETDTLCRGKHYQCEIFTDRTGKFVTGELNYMQPKKTYTPPKIILSEEEREQIEMKLTDEIEKYWRDDD